MSCQDTRATAFRERFFAYSETALAPSPALKPSMGARSAVPDSRRPWKDMPGTFGAGNAEMEAPRMNSVH
jgi:hypothetical protein